MTEKKILTVSYPQRRDCVVRRALRELRACEKEREKNGYSHDNHVVECSLERWLKEHGGIDEREERERDNISLSITRCKLKTTVKNEKKAISWIS